jgi:3-methyladenine DNA glycosylase AlkC
MYNTLYFERLCPVLKECIPGFDCRDFIFRVFNNAWPDLELKERVRQITHALHHFLSVDFPTAANELVMIADRLMEVDRAQGFANIFLPDYIEVYGQDHPDESLKALEQITKLVSGEYAIRPFIIKYPQKAMSCLYNWSQHPDANVRRLASEGCRPRLPWAIGLPKFKADPTPILPVLENLKADPSEYVRKSVANNLNDIAKDNPQTVLSIFRQWHGTSPHTDWILRHGCRSLLKKGHEEALSLHGFNPGSRAAIQELKLSKKLRIGDFLSFSFAFINGEKSAMPFRLEYAIDYPTSSGRFSKKVFKLRESTFPAGTPVSIERKQSFKDLSTRKHFKGAHRLTILANGKKLAGAEFMVH